MRDTEWDGRDSRVQDDLPALIEAFGLGVVHQLRFINEGLMNLNWRLSSGRGAFALKQIVDVPPERARRNLKAVISLAADDLPVCAPEPSVKGDLVVEIAGRSYCLFEWVVGEHRPGTELALRQVHDLGVLLGRIHRALDHLRSRGQLPEGPAGLRGPVRPAGEATAEADRFLGCIARLESQQQFDVAVREALERRMLLLERYASQRPVGDLVRGPVGWTHGDFQYRNLLWRGHQVAAVLDWDRIGFRSYAEEVVRTAQVQFGGEDGLWDLDRVAAFTAAYRSVIPLGDEELGDAVERLWWKRMTDFWVLQFHYDRDDHSCDGLWDPGERLLDWWSAHREDVRLAFTACEVAAIR